MRQSIKRIYQCRLVKIDSFAVYRSHVCFLQAYSLTFMQQPFYSYTTVTFNMKAHRYLFKGCQKGQMPIELVDFINNLSQRHQRHRCAWKLIRRLKSVDVRVLNVSTARVQRTYRFCHQEHVKSEPEQVSVYFKTHFCCPSPSTRFAERSTTRSNVDLRQQCHAAQSVNVFIRRHDNDPIVHRRDTWVRNVHHAPLNAVNLKAFHHPR